MSANGFADYRSWRFKGKNTQPFCEIVLWVTFLREIQTHLHLEDTRSHGMNCTISKRVAIGVVKRAAEETFRNSSHDLCNPTVCYRLQTITMRCNGTMRKTSYPKRKPRADGAFPLRAPRSSSPPRRGDPQIAIHSTWWTGHESTWWGNLWNILNETNRCTRGGPAQDTLGGPTRKTHPVHGAEHPEWTFGVPVQSITSPCGRYTADATTVSQAQKP
jgi:hypothetical protein